MCAVNGSSLSLCLSRLSLSHTHQQQDTGNSKRCGNWLQLTAPCSSGATATNDNDTSVTIFTFSLRISRALNFRFTLMCLSNAGQ